MSLAIQLEQVSKRFGSVQAVDEVSLELAEGSLCGFLGPNGAGKSTTIRMIMSIISPDSGVLRVLGGSALDNKDRIGYLPEERGLYRKMRVGEFLAYIAKLKGVHPTGLQHRINDWLERVQLPAVAKKRCEELSKGMQQKVQLLSALMHRPDLLILDEPYSGLDPLNSRLITELIREEQRRGATIIFSTHQMHTAEALCDRVLLINKGKKVLDANLSELRAQHDGRGIIVEPAGDPTAYMHAALAAGFAAHAESTEKGLVEIELREGIGGNDALQAALAAGACRTVSLRRLSLEDVFVQLVGGSVAELRGEGGSADV
ncbi:MAG: ATP-binding cassette domain-containing protein [Phycisphaerales bacterium]|nr:ATP-binding cassette domain-containing protein [Phycisphaerales bacterium]